VRTECGSGIPAAMNDSGSSYVFIAASHSHNKGKTYSQAWWTRKKSPRSFFRHSGGSRIKSGRNPVFSGCAGPRRSPGWRDDM